MCTALMCCHRLECEENFLEHKEQSKDDALGWTAVSREDLELETLAAMEKSLDGT